jgi:predicted transcriptional regulator
MHHNDDTKYTNADQIHHAYAVIDETTGKQLEFRQLIRHPKHQLTWLPSAANEFG